MLHVNSDLRQKDANMSLFTILVGILVSVTSWTLYIIWKRLHYWEQRKVPYVKSYSIFGNFKEYILQQKTNGEVEMDICRMFPEEPYVGSFYGTEPTLIVQDLELLKLITTKDYYYFSSREISNYTTKEVFTQSLFFTYGDKWKVLRQTLTPLFSSVKMKNMFYLVENCSKVWERKLDEEISKSNVKEMKAMMARFTMDCIGSCVFGIETKAMENDVDNPFITIGSKILEISRERGITTTTRAIWPAIFYGLGFKTFPTEVNHFFSNLLGAVFTERQKSGNIRNDFIDLLKDLKKNQCIVGDKMEGLKSSDGEKISLEVNDSMLISQAMAFFAAGYDTSANTSSAALYELAKYPEIQQRVLDEVDSYLKTKNGKLEFDCTTELPYLDQCISEALRLYPVLTILTREVFEDYVLPDGLKLERGLRVHIPVYHLHMNPKHFPEPEKFKPERFEPEQKKRISPYAYMPFGVGPRLCIGLRFAKMQMIAGLITILKKYRVELADGMPRQVTLEPKALVTQSKEPIMIKFVERVGWEDRLLK